MYYLIKKDFLIQKKSVWLAILFMLFFTITLINNLGYIGFSVSILAITYQLVTGASALEMNGEVILGSLPIPKYKIVLAKYISVYIFAIYAILINGAIYGFIHLFQLPIHFPFSSISILSSLAIVSVLFAISFPFTFKLGYLKSKMPNMILFFAISFIGTPVIFHLMENDQSSFRLKLMAFFSNGVTLEWIFYLLIPLLLLLIVSYFISLSFYKKKEF